MPNMKKDEKKAGWEALTNRGPAGLEHSIRKDNRPSKSEHSNSNGKVNHIECDGQVVAIESLVPDPMNARLHPERNLEAIRESLRLYGQRKPLVVRSENRMVAAGNGTLEAAKQLGWTQIAVSMRPMTDAVFMGFALADNRTAELAKWDFEVVAKLDALKRELGDATMPGWTTDELEVLRAADWTPPQAGDDSEHGDEGGKEHTCPQCGHTWRN